MSVHINNSSTACGRSISMYTVPCMYMYVCCGFESHLRQLIFLRKSDCLGCAVLLCLVVCLTLLASFFLPSHLSLKHVHVCTLSCTMYIYIHIRVHDVLITCCAGQTKRKNTEDRKLTEGVRRQVIDHLSQSLQNRSSTHTHTRTHTLTC